MKLNKIISIFTSVLVGGALLSSTVNACSNCNPPSDVVHGMGDLATYTFNILMQLTDEQVESNYYNYGYGEPRYFTNFGDETLTDEEKFEAFCKYDEDDGELLYNCYKSFRSGQSEPFCALCVRNKFELDYSATAEDLGFPSDWKLTCYTGEYENSCWLNSGAEYRLFVPAEVFNDYETFVRLYCAINDVRSLYDMGKTDIYIDSYVLDPFELIKFTRKDPIPIEEKTFMYNELMQLTDDEIVDIFGDEYVQYGFGSDTIDDNQKFLNDFDENEEKLYNQLVSGETKPFFRLVVDEDRMLNESITAAYLGLPKNWKVELVDESDSENNLKAYDVYFSNDVLEDYEKYVRLNYALDHVLKENYYSITGYEDMFEVCNSEPPVTTTVVTVPSSTTSTTVVSSVSSVATTTETTPAKTTEAVKTTEAIKTTEAVKTTEAIKTTEAVETTEAIKTTEATSATTTVATTTAPAITETTTTTHNNPVWIRPLIKGDVNIDGTLDVRDCAYIASKLAQGKKDELPECADYNGDGKINVRDAAALAKSLAGK